MSESPYLLNADDVPWTKREHGPHVVEERHVSLGMPARKLSYGVTRIPPGARSFPFHFHYDNEECFIVVSGRGQLRYGEETVTVQAGDVITCPPGPDSAHQFINDGQEPLEYLAVGTAHTPDLVAYPDSGKLNVLAGSASGGDKSRRSFGGIFRIGDTVDYWEGEA
jgi:uncharacterized cupin superfamily protein